MAWGDHIEFLEDMALDGECPQALLDRPEIDEHLFPVWAAFWSLQGDRASSFGGVRQIPFMAFDAYARRFGPHETDAFDRDWQLVQRLDRDYLAELAARQPKPSDPGK